MSKIKMSETDQLRELLITRFAPAAKYSAICKECCSSLGVDSDNNSLCEMTDKPLSIDDNCPQALQCIEEIVIPQSRLSKTFLMSDFHFDHQNIIKYCNRPFRDFEEMNRHMLNRYASVVRSDSLFIFLGDMTFGRDSKGARYWLTQLPGDIIYLKGSHDQGIRPTSVDLNCLLVCDELIVHTPERSLLCIHEPERASRQDLWVIHGHHHNNYPERYPFVNHSNQTMNLSVEMVDYVPVSLTRVLEEIRKGE